MFKANQLFSLEINVLYNLMLNIGMLTYVIKISSKILPFSYPFVDMRLVFTGDTFHFNLRKTDVFPLKPGARKWNKERPKSVTGRYGL